MTHELPSQSLESVHPDMDGLSMRRTFLRDMSAALASAVLLTLGARGEAQEPPASRDREAAEGEATVPEIVTLQQWYQSKPLARHFTAFRRKIDELAARYNSPSFAERRKTDRDLLKTIDDEEAFLYPLPSPIRKALKNRHPEMKKVMEAHDDREALLPSPFREGYVDVNRAVPTRTYLVPPGERVAARALLDYILDVTCLPISLDPEASQALDGVRLTIPERTEERQMWPTFMRLCEEAGLRIEGISMHHRMLGTVVAYIELKQNTPEEYATKYNATAYVASVTEERTTFDDPLLRRIRYELNEGTERYTITKEYPLTAWDCTLRYRTRFTP